MKSKIALPLLVLALTSVATVDGPAAHAGSSKSGQNSPDSSDQGGGTQNQSTTGDKSQGQGNSPSAGGATTPSVTVGSNTGVMENYILAASSLQRCSAEIAKKVPDDIKRVVLFDPIQHDMLEALGGFFAQTTVTATILKAANDSYAALPNLPVDLVNAGIGPGVTETVPIINAAVGAISNLASLFRTDINIGGALVNLDDEILIDDVISNKKSTNTFFRPSLYFSQLLDPAAIATSTVVTKLQDLYQQRNVTQVNIVKAQGEIKQLTTKLQSTKTADARTRIRGFLDQRTQALSELQAAAAVFDTLIGGILGK